MSPTERGIRVVLADDQDLVRTGFRMILESEPGIEVVGQASDGEQAVQVAQRLRPDLVLMDIQMPGVDGLTATRRILGATPDVRVLILTTFERDDYIFDAVQAGASGFLLKNAPPEDLIRAVHIVAAGEALLAPSVTRRVMARLADQPVRVGLDEQLRFLTEREVDVLRLLALGLSNAEIANELIVGESTVKTHVSRVLSKLHLRDRVQAVVFAYESGLVRPGG
jgi:DNA-binding NarL/FixJ family response regulator